jgi:hypothetical protein
MSPAKNRVLDIVRAPSRARIGSYNPTSESLGTIAMMAYCDLRNGAIRLGHVKPRRAVVIAEHDDAAVLCRAIEQAGAWAMTEYRGRKIADAGLAVPWFSTAKYPDEEEDCARQFAKRVQGLLSCV